MQKAKEACTMMKAKIVLTVVLTLNTISAYALVLPELPRAYVDTSMPTTSITKTVCNNGCDYTNDKLQQAIDDAQLGTTILLQQGVTYTPLDDRGFLLKNKTSGTGWIVIKPARAETILPAAGTRLTPAYSNQMPKIVRPYVGMYAMTCDTTAHHYRIIGIEFMNPGNVDTAIAGAAYVNCSSLAETSLASQSHHIIFDRIYIHGPDAPGSYGVKFGLILNGQHEGVIDSTIENLTYDTDAITVISWAGAGPFVIRNNSLSSSGENIMFGGADTQIANLVPSDIEIRNNYIYKPLKWRDDPAYNSGSHPIRVKNLYESKNVQRVLVDGNIFENMWPGMQEGYAMTFVPRQATALSTQPWTVIQDITITNNVFRNTANGLYIVGMDTGSMGPPTLLGGRYLISNNLFIKNGGYPGKNIIFQLSNGVFDVTIKHNTVASSLDTTGTTLALTYGPANSDYTQMERIVFQDNLLQAKSYPVFALGDCSATTLSSAMPAYIWTNNVFAGPWPTSVGCESNRMPQGSGNAYPLAEATLGYTNPDGGDYRLSSASPYKRLASDGKDIGVDWPSFDAAQDPMNQGLIPALATSNSTSTSSSTITTTSTTTSPTSTTTSSTDTTTSTITQTSKRFLGKLKQLMDKVR